jgi:hypothetical protein
MMFSTLYFSRQFCVTSVLMHYLVSLKANLFQYRTRVSERMNTPHPSGKQLLPLPAVPILIHCELRILRVLIMATLSQIV